MRQPRAISLLGDTAGRLQMEAVVVVSLSDVTKTAVMVMEQEPVEQRTVTSIWPQEDNMCAESFVALQIHFKPSTVERKRDLRINSSFDILRTVNVWINNWLLQPGNYSWCSTRKHKHTLYLFSSNRAILTNYLYTSNELWTRVEYDTQLGWTESFEQLSGENVFESEATHYFQCDSVVVAIIKGRMLMQRTWSNTPWTLLLLFILNSKLN